MSKEKMIKRTIVVGYEGDTYSPEYGISMQFRAIPDKDEFIDAMQKEGFYVNAAFPVQSEYQISVEDFKAHAELIVDGTAKYNDK